MRDDEVKAPQQPGIQQPGLQQSGTKGKEARRTIILRPNHLLGDAKKPEALNESAPVGRLASLITKPQQSTTGASAGSPASEAQVAGEKVADEKVADTKTADAKVADTKVAEKPVEEGVGSDIVIMQGPGGLIVTSEDKAALEQFDRLMRMLSEQSQMGTGEPTVIYLQNIKAAAAKELLETIMSGSTSSSSGGGSLLGDLAGGVMGGGMFGALLGGGGGSSSSSSSSTSGMASGDYTITADPRLNCLIINASPQDMALCEELLKVIDQVESPYSIETKGQLALIPVISQDVSQVLATLKTLYADRIEGAAAGGAGAGANRQPDPRELIEALRGGGGGGARGGRGGASSELKESKIALSADTNTNTLIVIAQPQVIKEIETLIQAIDEAGGGDGEETITVVPIPGGTKGKSLGQALSRALGAKAKVNTTPAEGSNQSSQQAPQGGGNSGSSSEDDARRRAEFFQRMRDSGAFGGGGQSGGRTFTLPSGGGSGGTRGSSGGNSGRGGR